MQVHSSPWLGATTSALVDSTVIPVGIRKDSGPTGIVPVSPSTTGAAVWVVSAALESCDVRIIIGIDIFSIHNAVILVFHGVEPKGHTSTCMCMYVQNSIVQLNKLSANCSQLCISVVL